jgi:hypothetical protein
MKKIILIIVALIALSAVSGILYKTQKPEDVRSICRDEKNGCPILWCKSTTCKAPESGEITECVAGEKLCRPR